VTDRPRRSSSVRNGRAIDTRRLVLEGGSIDVNGGGTLLTTEECLLSPVQARNPGVERAGLEQALADHLGIRKVLWLGRGIAGDDTHGHVDDLARFVDAQTVVLASEDDKADVNYQPLRDNHERLARMTNQDGAPIGLAKLPMPSPLFFDGQRLPASYANFYIGNEAVIVPTFNDRRDREALAILAGLFPTRRVVGIHAVDLVWGLGTLHCMTQQEPSAAARAPAKAQTGRTADVGAKSPAHASAPRASAVEGGLRLYGLGNRSSREPRHVWPRPRPTDMSPDRRRRRARQSPGLRGLDVDLTPRPGRYACSSWGLGDVGGSYVTIGSVSAVAAGRGRERLPGRFAAIEALDGGVNALGPQNVLGLVRESTGFASQVWIWTLLDDDFVREKTHFGEVPYFGMAPRTAWEELLVLASYKIVTAYKTTKPPADIEAIVA
jgi:hypothetical protein